jgi:hypothetical protein
MHASATEGHFTRFVSNVVKQPALGGFLLTRGSPMSARTAGAMNINIAVMERAFAALARECRRRLFDINRLSQCIR